MLLSAGEAVPTDIVVHGYLTENGRKISKSSGAAGIVQYRRPVRPRRPVRDGRGALVAAARGAQGRGRRLHGRAASSPGPTTSSPTASATSSTGSSAMIHRYQRRARPGAAADPGPGARRPRARPSSDAPGLIAEALEDFDFRRATEAVWRIADEANRYVNRARPWDAGQAGDRRRAGHGPVRRCCWPARRSASTCAPFLPDAASRITRQCTPDAAGRLPGPFRCCQGSPRRRMARCLARLPDLVPAGFVLGAAWSTAARNAVIASATVRWSAPRQVMPGILDEQQPEASGSIAASRCEVFTGTTRSAGSAISSTGTRMDRRGLSTSASSSSRARCSARKVRQSGQSLSPGCPQTCKLADSPGYSGPPVPAAGARRAGPGRSTGSSETRAASSARRCPARRAASPGW